MMEGYKPKDLTKVWESDNAVLPFPPNSKLARAFFVAQRYTTAFPPREAMNRENMFPDVVTPWPSNDREGM